MERLIINDTNSQFFLDEPLGKQKKSWYLINGEQHLIKMASYKQDGSEVYNDVSECIASDIANLIGVDTAKYHLALKDGRKCVITKNFLDNKQVMSKQYELIDGVRLISAINPDFNNMELKNRKTHQLYTVSLILECIKKYGFEKEVLEMIVFDALIANQDRNPANFSIISNLKDNTYSFAPLYDSCTSMGISMAEKRLEKCITSDMQIDEQHLNEVIHYHIVNKITLERSLQYKEKRVWDKKEIDNIISKVELLKEELRPLLDNRRIYFDTYLKKLNKIYDSYNKYNVTKLQYQQLMSYLTVFYPDEIKDIIERMEINLTNENIESLFDKYTDNLPANRIYFAKELVKRRSRWMIEYYNMHKEESRGKLL